MYGYYTKSQKGSEKEGLITTIPGYALSGRPLARGDWKCLWVIGMHFNGHLPGDWI